MSRYLIPLVIFAVLVVFLAIGLKLDPKLVPSPLIDKPAPEFNLPKVKMLSENVSNTDFVGQVSLLNVWASWCVSCRAEHKVLLKLQSTGEVPIYGLDYKDKREDAIRWLKRLGDPYVASASDIKGIVGIHWGVYGVPETFVIDKQGIIRYKHIGPLEWEDVQEKILPLVRKLKGKQN